MGYTLAIVIRPRVMALNSYEWKVRKKYIDIYNC